MFKIQTRQRAQYYSRVIELYLTGELSVRRIAKILPVGRATISRWIDNFAAENPETVQRVMSKRLTRKSLGKDVSPSGEETIASLRAELKVLRARLKDAEIKAEFYDEMINIAEREFNIPIRKKPGAKQHAKAPGRYAVCALCALFGVSKQAYYKHDECKTLSRLAAESFAIEYVMNVRSKDPLIGGLKLWHMYKREFQGNAPLGRDRFADLLDREGLKVRRRIRKPRTTDSRHGLPVWCDLTKELIPTRRDQLWVSDITYITIWADELHYSFCYLSLIQDAFTKEIIGWSVGPTLDTGYPLQALETALKRIDGVENADLIHHSDRGCQYACTEYIRKLRSHGIRISMTETGNPKDNARAERINGTIKNELLGGMRFHSIDRVREAVRKAVDFYNNERPHMSIDMLTPSQAAARSGEIAKRWTSYREKAIREKLRDLKNQEISLSLDTVHGSPSGLHPPVNP